jgi:Plasmid encoded RepA protein
LPISRRLDCSGDQELSRTECDAGLRLKISRQTLRQLDGIELVRFKRERRKQNLGFSSRPFILCGLPVRRPPSGQLLFERRNGQFVLQVTGHPDYGLPFGQDRIVPIFLATLAVRQQSQTIRFRSGSEMLDTFGMHKGGKEYRRLVAAFERIFGATIFFGTDSHLGTARVVRLARFAFLREAQIWYTRGPAGEAASRHFENIIVLSEEFYQEILSHPIPTDLEAVKVLSGAPAVLDLFMWLCYRCFVSKGEESIPLFGKYGLASQLGSIEYSRPRRFRAMLDQWLGVVRALWPECPAQISPDGQAVKIDHAAPVLL